MNCRHVATIKEKYIENLFTKDFQCFLWVRHHEKKLAERDKAFSQSDEHLL